MIQLLKNSIHILQTILDNHFHFCFAVDHLPTDQPVSIIHYPLPSYSNPSPLISPAYSQDILLAMPRPIHSPALLSLAPSLLAPSLQDHRKHRAVLVQMPPPKAPQKGSWSPAHAAVCSTVSQHLQPLYLYVFPQRGHKLHFEQLSKKEDFIPQSCEGEGDCWNHLVGIMKGALSCPVVTLLFLGMHLIAF